MLYLNPPFWVINGISLFPDHADPAQFYYMPLRPHLTTRRDNTARVDVPQIQLIKYRGGAGNGGFLSCDIDLSLPEGLLEDTASELKNAAKLDKTPRLSPVPVVDGTVRIMLLGQESAAPTDPAPKPGVPQPEPRFVIKMQSAGRPSLYGDENVIFSAQLDQEGVTIVEKALMGEISPVGVVYSLDFYALRPAYSVRVNVDWSRVQHHLDESFKVNVVIYSSEIDKVVDELIESRVIVVEADTFVPDDDENKDVTARRDQALAEVRSMIKSTFFESSIDPPKPGDTSTMDDLRTVVQYLASGGMSSSVSFGYKKVDITRIDHKTLNASFQERTTVRKTIWPQGHLSGLFSAVRAGLPLDHFIIPVDLDDPYFQRRAVEAIARADFEGDGIQSIDAVFTYNGAPKSALLEAGAGKDRASVSWPSELSSAGGLMRDIAYRYRVTFKNADRSQRPVQLESGLFTTEEDKVEIVPRETLYGIADVPITALSFPWDRYPMVDVECRYADESNEIRQSQLFRLISTVTSATFRLFMRDPSKRRFDHRITYHGADGKDISLPWTTADDEQVLVRDPYPTKRQLVVVPQVDWTAVERVFVDLSYQDGPDEEDEIYQSFEFNAKDNGSKTFVVNPKDPTRKLVAYEVTVLMKDLTKVSVPRSYTVDRRLILRADMRGHRVVTVAPPPRPFDEAHVQRVEVSLRYVDRENGLSFNDEFTFRSASDHASFEFDYVDGSKSRYEYKITTRYDNGMAREGEWTPESTDTLVVPVE